MQIPLIESYSSAQLEEARKWPAIQRYLSIIERSPTSFSERLRWQRHHAWLRAALATCHEAATAKDVCEFWSQEAEKLILEANQEAGTEQFCILALGKLGACELNLSSDVDLIFVRPDDSDFEQKRMRDFQSLLSEHTSFGFALRVDLNLRPGGRSSALVPTQSEFEYHYGYQGEMWERLAFVRMRILSGPEKLTDDINTFSRKFSYRKHLDYTLLEDLKALRAKIRQEWFARTPSEFHLKLGIGGIREIELFTHALQIMHGGRNAHLRTHSTTTALERLAEAGTLPEADSRRLHEAYWYLRDLENRLHAYEDQQNYLLDLRKQHAALPLNYQPRLFELTQSSESLVSSLLGTGGGAADTLPDSLEAQRQLLLQFGFSKFSYEETWPELLAATVLSRRTEKDEQARQTFLWDFVHKLNEIGLDKDLGLSLLLDFVKATRAKASFFTLLNREPRLRDDLAWLFSTSPYLANIIASRPELIDSFLLRTQQPLSEDLNSLLEELAERRLLSELISANRFLSDRNLSQLCANLSANADEISLHLLRKLQEEYGDSELGLVAMGKWGGRELGLRSDLDFIFVSVNDASAVAQKTAKRFLSRMTEPHKGGSIYSVDMRLRPSGHAGPILVSVAQLQEHLMTKAAAWERQSYLRARPLISLTINPAQTACVRGLSKEDRAELLMIRQKLFVQSPLSGEVDLKLEYGGLAAIEFAAQIALLSRREFSLDPSTQGMIQYLQGVDSRWRETGPMLLEKYEFLRTIEQLQQLTTSQSGSKLQMKSDSFKRLALILGSQVSALEQKLRNLFSETTLALNQVNDLGEK